ncbi:MAG: metal ABC transporter ATP-binding protein [Deltaproteobacteria bacterium]|jgi:zinc transport system ATP-binding protein|nr:metal ABC transporter ATP-binding protein [Deltaproteobacteria bacterium]
MNPPLVKLENLEVTLGRYPVLQGVSCKFPAKRQTVIIGPNGAGKSTLVQTILGHWNYLGSITFDPPGPRFGYVPQRLDFDRHLPLTVLEFLALPLTVKPLWLGLSKKIKEEAVELLSSLEAEHLIDKPLGALSGGETQRILLGAALLSKPDLLILDEPNAGTDIQGEKLLCDLIDSVKENLTVIMVSHDLPTAKAHGDWVICLNHRVIAQGPPEEVFKAKTLESAFGLHYGPQEDSV